MKRKKYFIFINIIFAIVVAAGFFHYFSQNNEKILQQNTLQELKQNKIDNNSLGNEIKIKIPTEEITKIEEPEISEDINSIKATLFVFDKKYEVSIRENSSVYDAMTKIKNENQDFDFNYKDYPSLGIFVYKINGVKESPNKYWIYYINNIEASVGVSNYILKDGDSILWMQE